MADDSDDEMDATPWAPLAWALILLNVGGCLWRLIHG